MVNQLLGQYWWIILLLIVAKLIKGAGEHGCGGRCRIAYLQSVIDTAGAKR